MSKKSAEQAKPSTPQVAPAKYGKLPRPCDAVGSDLVKKLVPNAKNSGGTEGKSSDPSLRASCSWNGLDGYQFRWLDISFQRFESNSALGAGEKRAKEYFTKQVKDAGPKSAKDAKTADLKGLGDRSRQVIPA